MTIESMKKSAQKGFTLIELMIVIAIIGILASIAIPEFAAFRTKAFNSAAMSDVKNGVTVIEGSFSTSYAYPTIGTAVVATATTTLGGDNWTPSDGVTVGTGVGTATTYKLCAKHLTGDTIYTKTNATKNVAGVKTAASEGTALVATDCT